MLLRVILIFLFLFTSINAFVQEKKPLTEDHIINKALKKLRTDKDLKNASIGFYAIDTKTGETIAELNPDLSLMPASTQKIITTATAIEVLGKDYRFKTSIQYSGYIDTLKKILHGDLYIKGGADPTLGSEYFNKGKDYVFIKTWISALIESKIDSIDGRIIADASDYGTEITPPKWSWEDVGNYYGSGANGLTAFDNQYEIHFISSPQKDTLTTISKIQPEIPGLKIYNEVLSSDIKSDQAFVFASPYSYIHYLRGTIPKGKQDFVIRGAIPDPAYFLAWYFNNELKKAGIGIKNEPTTDRLMKINGDSILYKQKEIKISYSPALSKIIDVTNKKSINLFAEHLFNEIAYKLRNSWSNSEAIKAVKDYWRNKGLDTEGFFIFDGSGLSRYNAISMRHMVFILNYMVSKGKNYDDFLQSLPIAGESGTLKSLGKNTTAQGKVIAKSGSIGRVRAYAGYTITKSGRYLAFSVNLSNYNCTDSDAREKLTELMIAMADFDL